MVRVAGRLEVECVYLSGQPAHGRLQIGEAVGNTMSASIRAASPRLPELRDRGQGRANDQIERTEAS